MRMLSRALAIFNLGLLACLLAANPVRALIPADSSAAAPRSVSSGQSGQALAVRAVIEKVAANDPVEKTLVESIGKFYEGGGYELIWIGERQATRQMTALRRRMDAAEEYGLDPVLYRTANFALTYPADTKLLARADVEFSLTVARFVTHIASGRISPAEVSRLITLRPERPDVAKVLETLTRGAGVAIALGRFEPPHPQYRALKAKLAELRASNNDDRIVIPEGTLLKPASSDQRAPLLRARLNVSLSADADPERYDEPLVEAVQAFQRGSGLNADGILGPRTIAALNGWSREEDIASIVANLERWRWMPHDLGAFHVMVNVPEFMVRVVKDGSPVHQTRVVVGTPKHPTPTFSHVMDHFVVNPYWNVPTSIVSNEMVPDIRRDPYGYFSRNGYQVFASVGGKMRQVNPAWINWYAVNPRQIRIRQVPGDRNALGRIKFMFPNQHSVYLHDTPSKSLFRRDYRAFSHGCVRVENPLEFADAILPVAAPEWNSTRIERLYGGKERRVNLNNPIPVHLSYFTVAIDPNGELRRFEDIYDYDGRMEALVGSSAEG